jgi:hypothetical protein
MNDPALDDWLAMSTRWRALALEHYEPLSEARCDQIIQETLDVIKNHKYPGGTNESGNTGWRDSVQLDDDQSCVRVLTRKTLKNTELEQIVDHSWLLYTDGDSFKTAHLGDKCEFFVNVLQEFSPDTIIIHRVEKYPDLVQLTHSLAIAFRVKTETGHMIVFRCIGSPKLQSHLKAEDPSFSGSFFWETFDATYQDDRGSSIEFTLAGTIGSDNPTYARRWRNELVNSLVRYENEFMDVDTPIGSNDSTIEGRNDATSDSNVKP